MKQCGECFTFSPNDALFCIECSNPFATTGATERLTPYPQSGMGCSVYKIVAEGNVSGSFVYYPGYTILIGTLGSSNVNSFTVRGINI